jgi:hypothetical protein
MATFQTLQDRVTRRVIDLPAAVTTEVPDLVNKAIRRLMDLHNFKVMETETAQLLTTAATRALQTAVPTDLKELRGRPYLVKNDGTTRDLLVAANRQAALDAFPLNDPDDKGEPKLILDPEPSDAGVRTWEVWPFPDGLSDWSGGEYRIVIPYWRYLPVLSGGTDTNWFTENVEWYIVFDAASEAFFLDWDETRGAVMAQKAAGEFDRALKVDKRARLGSVRQLAIHLDVFAPQLRS